MRPWYSLDTAELSLKYEGGAISYGITENFDLPSDLLMRAAQYPVPAPASTAPPPDNSNIDLIASSASSVGAAYA